MRLLVSVRSAAEAAAALAGGSEVIDVKEPAEGPLGRASDLTIAAVIDRVAGRAPVTAALGDLPAARTPADCRGLAVAKVGLAGCAGLPWRDSLERLADSLPQGVALAAAAYSDHAAARAPSPEEVLRAAAALGLRWMVLDTWEKRGGSLLAGPFAASVPALLAEASDRGLSVVLAGGLAEDDILAAVALGPTLVGVRGAACVGGRGGVVSAGRVRALAQRLAAVRTERA